MKIYEKKQFFPYFFDNIKYLTKAICRHLVGYAKKIKRLHFNQNSKMR